MLLPASDWTKLFIFFSFLVVTTSAATSYSARRKTSSYPSMRSSSSRGYSLFTSSRYSSSHRHQPTTATTSYPGGSLKRTMYTGRYCAYTRTKMVPHKVPNGTESYMKQVVTKCHWSAVYCTPRVNYVVSSRITYKTVMKEVKKEEWECCPGFEGENCEKTCLNCTTMSDLTQRVTELEQQIQSGEITNNAESGTVIRPIRNGQKGEPGEPGPVGPRGPAGEPGAVGPRGPGGQTGQKGAQGRPGVAGVVGPMGRAGEKGDEGPIGPRGEIGEPGPPGLPGNDGAEGPRGPEGPKGAKGIPGIPGIKGERGAEGATGPQGPIGPSGVRGASGMKGDRGERGEMGPPGPAGQCGCPGNTAAPPGEISENGSEGENIDPSGVFPDGVTTDGPEGNPTTNKQQQPYCDGILWRKPLANLSCDFGPIKRAKNGLRLKKRSIEKRKAEKIIYERIKRQRSGSPAYYVMDDLKIPEDFGDFSDISDLPSIEDLVGPNDSGGTYCLWSSSPMPPSPPETGLGRPPKSWKVRRLFGAGLDDDYYNDFYHEMSELLPDDDDTDIANYFYSDYVNSPTSSFSSRAKRNIDMDLLMYAKGPPFDATTASTSGDGFYLIWNASESKISGSADQFLSPFFTNTHSDICLNFKYFVHADSHETTSRTIDGGFLLYLLPCNPSYKTPVLNLTGSDIANKTDRWVDATAPLPRHMHPYQIIFEGVRPKSQQAPPSRSDAGSTVPRTSRLVYVALDDIVFAECGSSACTYEGKYYAENEMWTNNDCRECICVEGSVSCLEITCPLLDCTYKYKPEGYCCEKCCPVQHVDSMIEASPSGDGSYDDDGSYESIYSDDLELNATYEVGDYDDIGLVDAMGCPMVSDNAEFRGGITYACSLRKDPGPCTGKYQRYYFDKLRGECIVFTYGGCEGNANAFNTLQECQQQCMPETTSSVDRSADAPASLVEGMSAGRWDILPRRCREEKATGPCRARFERFYYDAKEDRCKIFVWGGCGANGNNFVSPWACRDFCGGGEPHFDDVEDRCSMPKSVGTCKARYDRFYYDAETRSCRQFVYGGCNGNENNFETAEECENECLEDDLVTSRTVGKPDLCSQPMEPGPCRGSNYRFYYDTAKRRCAGFVYGGCSGNENNFETPEECRQTCGGRRVSYRVTVPKPRRVDTEGVSGPPGEQGPPGPPGPPGPAGIGLPGARGPPGPPGQRGPPGESASVELYKLEIASLREEVKQLATMVLTHVGDLNKHVDPTKTDDMGGFGNFFTNSHTPSTEDPDYTDYPWNPANYEYLEEEKK